jgi:hypothetical protein
MRKSTLLVLASMALALVLACMAAILTTVPSVAQTAATVTLVGAGDIASCNHTADSATARLVGSIAGTVFTLGDNVYPDGTIKQFLNCYDPTWGKYKKRTKPSAGNHDYYHTAGASGYFNYFGARAGAPSKGYYSYKSGSWHIVALNSNCEEVGGCGRRSAQLQWLRNDLRRNPAACTLAYWHHARFSSGKHGSDPSTAAFWRVLYNQHADVILSGHDHHYERFALQAPDGTRDREHGMRQFVVGTGGTYLRPLRAIEANSQVRNSHTHGVLKLTLKPSAYRWKFVAVAGKSFTDSGTTSCR